MNILFLTIGQFDSIETHSIYPDLLRCFRDNGNEIYAITPNESKTGKKTELVQEKGAHILHVETGNVTKANNLIKKGLAQLLLEPIYIKAIKRYFSNVKFEIVMYSTPPITFDKIVEFVKKRDGATSYLLLKDIFPQNAVDIGLLGNHGLKGVVYKYFRNKEKRLYYVSDCIGCMSQANVDYIIKNNPLVSPSKVEICPNCIEVVDRSVDIVTRKSIRNQYGIPHDKMVFVYGGNIGKPQGIPFLIECLKKCEDVDEAFFLIIGDGTEFNLLKDYVEHYKPKNVKIMKSLPKDDYDTMVGACDVGLIFLDHRFTIPNFPSRLLAYMQAKIPIIACTDPNTDIGRVIEDGEFGWWCESDDSNSFKQLILSILEMSINHLGLNGFEYLVDHYSVHEAYLRIINRCERER